MSTFDDEGLESAASKARGGGSYIKSCQVSILGFGPSLLKFSISLSKLHFEELIFGLQFSAFVVASGQISEHEIGHL
ncbi:hypothetical protein TYRP_016484 [Tyrophagus putrescentiae]|nr:hypothetical protein TYRP_016484 [Tyrophagus putrescentiae]